MKILERTKEIKSKKDLELDGKNKDHERHHEMSDAIAKVECWGIHAVPIFVAVCVVIATTNLIIYDFDIFLKYLEEVVKAVFYFFVGFLIQNKVVSKN